MRLHIGITNLSKYIKSLDKIQAGEFSTFENVIPKNEIIKKWRDSLPHEFRIIITAPKALTDPNWIPSKNVKWPSGAQGFQPGDTAMEIWNIIDKYAGKLRAFTILFRTPPHFRPTQQNIQKLKEFFNSINKKQYRLVWEPSGLWTQQHVLSVCDELGIYPAFDPLSPDFEPFSNSTFKYFRIKAINKTHLLENGGFDSIMEASYDAKRVFLVFATQNPIKHSKKFLEYLYNEKDDIGGWDE